MYKVLIVLLLYPDMIEYHICNMNKLDFMYMLNHNGEHLYDHDMEDDVYDHISDIQDRYLFHRTEVYLPLNKELLKSLDYILETGKYS